MLSRSGVMETFEAALLANVRSCSDGRKTIEIPIWINQNIVQSLPVLTLIPNVRRRVSSTSAHCWGGRKLTI